MRERTHPTSSGWPLSVGSTNVRIVGTGSEAPWFVSGPYFTDFW